MFSQLVRTPEASIVTNVSVDRGTGLLVGMSEAMLLSTLGSQDGFRVGDVVVLGVGWIIGDRDGDDAGASVWGWLFGGDDLLGVSDGAFVGLSLFGVSGDGLVGFSLFDFAGYLVGGFE